MNNILKTIILSNYRIFKPNSKLFEALEFIPDEIKEFIHKHQSYKEKLYQHHKRLDFYKEKTKKDLQNSIVLSFLNTENMNSKQFDKFIKTHYPVQTGLNNPILRAKSQTIPVDEIKSDKIQEFGQVLFRAMEIYDGVGLAAPQIGENIRMIAVCQLDKKLKNIVWADICINPKIISKKGEFIADEACLSLPGLEGQVKRANEIEVEYYDLEGKKQTKKASGYNAAIFQHEIDHLDGILFWDKAIKKSGELRIEKLDLRI